MRNLLFTIIIFIVLSSFAKQSHEYNTTIHSDVDTCFHECHFDSGYYRFDSIEDYNLFTIYYGNVQIVDYKFDTEIKCDKWMIDEIDSMEEWRGNVFIRRDGVKCYADSVNWDMLYNVIYFFEGGKIIYNDNQIVADWGQIQINERNCKLYYSVSLNAENPLKISIQSDTASIQLHQPNMIFTGYTKGSIDGLDFESDSVVYNMYERKVVYIR